MAAIVFQLRLREAGTAGQWRDNIYHLYSTSLSLLSHYDIIIECLARPAGAALSPRYRSDKPASGLARDRAVWTLRRSGIEIIGVRQ